MCTDHEQAHLLADVKFHFEIWGYGWLIRSDQIQLVSLSTPAHSNDFQTTSINTSAIIGTICCRRALNSSEYML